MSSLLEENLEARGSFMEMTFKLGPERWMEH